MNPHLKALHRELEALFTEGKALMASEALSDEQTARKEVLPDLIEQKKQEIAKANALGKSLAEGEAFLNGNGGMASLAANISPEDHFKAIKSMRRSRAKFFSLTSESRAEAQEKAHRFGMFIMASLKNNAKAKKFCLANGIPLMVDMGGNDPNNIVMLGQNEGIPEDGGVLVPPEFENDMIILREKFGVFRRYARPTPMKAETKSRSRRKGGLVAYFVGEDDQITESKKGWDKVNLIAKKLAVLTRTSTEFDEDAVIDVGDDLAGEISYAFAQKEDNCGFNGDGTSTYGGINGVRNRLLSVYGTGGGVGLTVASGTHWSDITLADCQAVVGNLPEYAETPNVYWFCHKTFYADVLLKLMLAAGGVTAAEVAQGAPRRFMGYDVVVCQIMPKTTGVSQIPLFHGDLALAADFGDRRATTIAMSEHVHFDSDEIAIRGTERFDINVHDVGNTTDPGPVVGLITAAS